MYIVSTKQTSCKLKTRLNITNVRYNRLSLNDYIEINQSAKLIHEGLIIGIWNTKDSDLVGTSKAITSSMQNSNIPNDMCYAIIVEISVWIPFECKHSHLWLVILNRMLLFCFAKTKFAFKNTWESSSVLQSLPPWKINTRRTVICPDNRTHSQLTTLTSPRQPYINPDKFAHEYPFL